MNREEYRRRRVHHRLDTLERAILRVRQALGTRRVSTLDVSPPSWSRDEIGGVACCLDCRREIGKHELALTELQTVPACCPWCARPRPCFA